MFEENKGSVNEPSYCKAEEHTVQTFAEAKKLADEVFKPYLSGEGTGERTSPAAKVRIRCQYRKGSEKETFRVVLLKKISASQKQISSKQKTTNEPQPADVSTEESDVVGSEPEDNGLNRKSAKRQARERSANRKAKS